MKRIGILGGTFDPPHRGHEALARRATRALALDRVVFVPCYTPPHRAPKRTWASPWERFAMCVLLTARHAHFDVSPIELKKGKRVFTFDLLKELQSVERGARLYFIMGEDSLYDLPTWRRPRALVGRFHFAVFPRRGNRKHALPQYVRERLKAATLASSAQREDLSAIWRIRAPLMEISSSDLRRQISEGKRPRGVPLSVFRYIKKRGLYRS